MKELTGLRIRTTTYKNIKAYQSFYSYTLKNTPFYFSLVWDSNISEEVRAQFSNNQILWEFGDGEKYTGPEAEHYYKWPGAYSVSAKVYDIDGDVHVLYLENLLQVLNAVPDTVSIGGLDNFSCLYALYAGKKTKPIKVARYNSWQHDDLLSNKNYTINLYSSGSNSAPITVKSYYTSQWSHLKKYCGFIERSITEDNVLTEKIVDTTTTTSVSMYARRVERGHIDGIWDIRLDFTTVQKEDTVFCGTSGEMHEDKTLHFIDQTPSDTSQESFVLLYASFDPIIFKDVNYDKYKANLEPYGVVNTVYSTQLIKSVFNSASSINITTNGITVEGDIDTGTLSAQKLYSFDIYPIKYTNTKIPFVITLKDSNGYTTKCYPNLTLDTTRSYSINSVNLSLIEVFSDGTAKEVEGTLFSANTSVPIYEGGHGYFAGLMKCNKVVNTAVISAVAVLQDQPLNLPSKGYCFLMQPGLNLFRRLRRLIKYGYLRSDIDDFSLFVKNERVTYSAPVSGGVSITYAPLYILNPLSGSYVWITDSNTDFIYVYSEDGERITPDINFQQLRYLTRGTTPSIKTLNVRKNSNTKSASPCNVAINSNGDAWVTLYDCITSFKIDKDYGIAKTYIIPDVKNIFYNNTTYTSLVTSTSGFAGENLILPTSIDVDRDDNVYISYTHPLKSFVCKYSDNGQLLRTFYFDFPYTAKNILIDGEDNLWVTTFNNSPVDALANPQTQDIVNRVDNLYYFNFKDNTRSFVTSFSFLGEITLDSGGNVWVNSENNIISKISKRGEIENFVIGSSQSGIDYVQDFGAFAGDLDGNILIVNNTDSVINYFPAINPKQLNDEDLPYVVLQGIENVQIPYQTKSLYNTVGDFTGVRWYNKNKPPENVEPRFVSGVSTLFTLKDLKSTIVKKNENYDIASTFKGYALQESLFNDEMLFENFFKPILNGNTSNLNELGKVIYEKISNFTDNISDIDKCNIVSLNSMYEMIGESVDVFSSNLPGNILRTLDLLSIKKCLLFGNINNFCNDFTLSAFEYNPYSNLGSEIDIANETFIPGLPIVSYEYFSKKYRLIHNTLVPELDMVPFKPYPLSLVKNNWGWGLVIGSEGDDYKQIKDYYKFYNFKPSVNTDVYDGLIDFNDPLTTIPSQNVSFSDWTKFSGFMEEILTSSLFTNLNLNK